MKLARVILTAAACLAVVLAIDAAAVAQCSGQGNATLVMKGNCDLGSTLKFRYGGAPFARYRVMTTFGSGPTEVPGVGTFCLDFGNGKQTVDAGRFRGRGVAASFWTLPDDPALIGEEVAFQMANEDADATNGVGISNAWIFTICDEGTEGNACVEASSDNPGSCGIGTIGFIAPVKTTGDTQFPAEISVRIVPADDTESVVDELSFDWSPDTPPTYPVASSDGQLVVTKVTLHDGYVVVMAEIDGTNSPSGMLPAISRLETYVGEDELIREVVTSCEEPLAVGDKFAPLFITRVTPVECEVVDCPLTLDFETEDDFATILVDGQDISTPPEFGNYVAISGDGNNQGPACYDSDPNGPNKNGRDKDLLVDLGNLLIHQSNDDPEQTIPGIFDHPNDSARGGNLFFDFIYPSELFSIDLIDICEGRQSVTVTLTDGDARTRVYEVPGGWTTDIAHDGPPGFGTLDLTTLADQPGFMTTATASEDDGFDPTDILRLTVFFQSSGATDNVVFCPAVPR